MSTSNETQDPRERSWLYIVSCIVLVVLAVIAIFTFAGARENKRAQEKADEFIAALNGAGARTPDKDAVAHVLGDDGGATCANPNDALSRATFLSLLANGATGPGARPVIADSRLLQGQLLIIKVYCPDQLDDFKTFVDGLKSDAVAG
jgi:hypothetical protein